MKYEKISDLLSEEEVGQLRKEFGTLVDVVGVQIRNYSDWGKRIRLAITFSIELDYDGDLEAERRRRLIAHALHSLEKKMLEVLSIRRV